MAPWITVLSQHTVFTKRVIYYKFTFVWYSAKQGTTHRPTSHLVHCVPFLWLWEHRWQRNWVHWPVFVMATSTEACCCCRRRPPPPPPLASAPNSKAVSATRISLMASSSSLIFFLAMALRSTIVCLFPLYMTGRSCRNIMPLNIWTSSTVTAKQI